MALDDALLDAVAGDPSMGWFRTYDWTVPTLSLGYFQRWAVVQADPRWQSVPVVRRPTGGGAIWHDRELTYALVVPGDHPLVRPSAALYRTVHAAIADLLCSRGLAAGRRGPSPAGEQEPNRPVLCFTDRDPEDIVACGRKVVGSAQRRRSGAVLQHGSLLLERSPMTPELPGISDLAPLSKDVAFWAGLLRERVPEAAGFRGAAQDVPEHVRRRAGDLEAAVYRDPGWTGRR